MVIVHRLFARLFRGDLVTDAEIEPWTQFSVHPRWRSILLQGMYLSPTGAYGSLMIELGRSILNHSGEAWNRDPNTMMRLAVGYRRVGDFDQALHFANQAIAGAANIDHGLHNQYSTLRDAIVRDKVQLDILNNKSAQLEAQLKEEFEAHSEDLQEQIQAAREELQRGHQELMLRIIEILALFTALLGVLVATFQTMIASDLGVKERVALLGFSVVFLIVFLVIIHLITAWKSAKLRE